MTIAVLTVVFVACVALCVRAANWIEESPEAHTRHVLTALAFGTAAVLASYWLGYGVAEWFMTEFQHGE